MKFRAELTPNAQVSKIWIDDKEISSHTNSIIISAKAGEVTDVELRLIPLETIHVDGEIETLTYRGINGEPLVSVAEAPQLWHCGCGTWNHVVNVRCRVCNRKEGGLDTGE